MMNLKALYKVGYGMYIISTKNKEGRFNAQIANTVFQVTSEPPQIAICLNKENLTLQYLQESKVFSISILSKNTPIKIIGKFGFKSGREINKFENTNYKIGKTGVPVVIDYTVAYIEAEVVNSFDVGSHILFIGKVINAEVLTEDETMTYEFYHLVKKGNSPTTAPTYINEKKLEQSFNLSKEESDMKKYRCIVCGYIYDPQKGDPENGIKPGTSFKKLPDNWVCPVCGAGKDKFEEYKD